MAGDASRGTPTEDASFEIPAHPERRYPYDGGVEYEGETLFTLTPERDHSEPDLRTLVEETLASGPYRHGDFLDLPMPLYLVRDDETADVFRLSIRDGRVRLHVLPATESAGLRAFYDRLVERSDTAWRVDCRTSG
jgi:hypothetical protein